jgi:hypothetical protein
MSSKEKKTAGIFCNNYKIEKFKAELINNGFKDFEVVPFKGDTSTIKVKFEPNDISKIAKICKDVELHFAAIKN